MIKKSVGEIAKETGIPKKVVLKHLNSRSLHYEEKQNSIYFIDDKIYDEWKNNVPDLNVVQSKSIFSNSSTENNNNIDLYEEVDLKLTKEEFISLRKINVNSEFTFADMFCGCGGLSLGFVEAGFKPVGFIDIFDDALKTYYSNIIKKNGFNITNDTKAIDISVKKNKEVIISHLKKEKVKVICGGFPCQGFSLSGTGVATDPRNTLYIDMLEIVREVQPQYIVMENVVGLVSMLKGKVLNKIISDYNAIGYKITYKIMNSVNYCVPQNRKRVIFIGNKMNKNNPFPKAILSENYITVKDAINKYGNVEDKTLNHIFSRHSEHMKKRLSEVPIGGHLYNNYHDSWRKTRPNEPSCTIKENHGATNIHYEFSRTMSPREIAALQSFPDDFIFEGSKTTILKQIGNAVPPLLAKAIALTIKNNLDK